MACEHKRIMSRNCVLYCADCGAKLPAQCAAGGQPEKNADTEKKPVKKPAKKAKAD
jgi:hypothetical protein